MKKDWKVAALPFIGLTFGALAIAGIAFKIALVVIYGGQPVEQIPFWVLWFLW